MSFNEMPFIETSFNEVSDFAISSTVGYWKVPVIRWSKQSENKTKLKYCFFWQKQKELFVKYLWVLTKIELVHLKGHVLLYS